MGKLRACLVIATAVLAACGNDHAATPDAAQVQDAPMADAPQQIDSPPTPDGPSYDFSCFGVAAPTMADDAITVAGTTESLSLTGVQSFGPADLATYQVGGMTPIDMTTSETATGAFTTGSLTTGGAPLDAYLEATAATYRTTYLYPPNPLTTSLTMVPVPLMSQATFMQATGFANITQDDSANGAMVVTVSDCSLTPINGATLSVQQNGMDQGTVFDIGALDAQAAGIFFVFNVPDGATDLTATYNGMTFPVRTVMAHAQADAESPGTITATALVPGP